MMRELQKFSNKLTALYSQMAMIFMFVLIFATFMQVFTRYVLNSSWPWTEELARYAFIWMNMVGAAAGLRKGTLVAVDVVPNALKGISRKTLLIILNSLEFICGLVLFVAGLQLISRVGDSPSIVMRVPMGFIHAAIPTGGFGFMINSIACAIDVINNDGLEVKVGGA